MFRIRLPLARCWDPHSTNLTIALIPSVDHRRDHPHPHQTGEGMNRKRGEKGQRDVVAVAWQRFWDVRSACSPSRWWWWTSLLLRVDGRVQGVLLAGAVVAGFVLVDVTGRGRLVVVVVTGRVWVEVTGRVWVALVTDCVMVVAGAVPTPAAGGRLNRFNASSTFIGYVRLKSSIS